MQKLFAITISTYSKHFKAFPSEIHKTASQYQPSQNNTFHSKRISTNLKLNMKKCEPKFSLRRLLTYKHLSRVSSQQVTHIGIYSEYWKVMYWEILKPTHQKPGERHTSTQWIAWEVHKKSGKHFLSRFFVLVNLTNMHCCKTRKYNVTPFSESILIETLAQDLRLICLNMNWFATVPAMMNSFLFARANKSKQNFKTMVKVQTRNRKYIKTRQDKDFKADWGIWRYVCVFKDLTAFE